MTTVKTGTQEDVKLLHSMAYAQELLRGTGQFRVASPSKAIGARHGAAGED